MLLDPRDESIPLPPLDQPDPNDVLWALTYLTGETLVVSPVDEKPVAAIVFSARGLMNVDGGSGWSQVHVAIPWEGLVGLRNRLNEILEEA